jgi:hypothetical protein
MPRAAAPVLDPAAQGARAKPGQGGSGTRRDMSEFQSRPPPAERRPPDTETNFPARRFVVASRRMPVPVSLIEPHCSGVRRQVFHLEPQLSPVSAALFCIPLSSFQHRNQFRGSAFCRGLPLILGRMGRRQALLLWEARDYGVTTWSPACRAHLEAQATRAAREAVRAASVTQPPSGQSSPTGNTACSTTRQYGPK